MDKTETPKPKKNPAAPKASGSDEKLWRHVVKDVDPLKKDHSVFMDAISDLKAPPIVKINNPPAPRIIKRAEWAAPDPQPASHVNPGLDRRTEDKIKKGKMPIEARLDLHGLSQAKAHEALDGFVAEAVRRGYRMILIITGKGGDRSKAPLTRGEGVLKRNVPHWLSGGRHAGVILRIYPAQAEHGGEGALYVYLRRARPGPKSK